MIIVACGVRWIDGRGRDGIALFCVWAPVRLTRLRFSTVRARERRPPARSTFRARRTQDFPASLIGSLSRGRGDAVDLNWNAVGRVCAT